MIFPGSSALGFLFGDFRVDDHIEHLVEIGCLGAAAVNAVGLECDYHIYFRQDRYELAH